MSALDAFGVLFPEGESASTQLLDGLRSLRTAFPESLSELRLPEGSAELKRRLADLLLEVEQRRAASPAAAQMAAHLTAHDQGALRFRPEGGDARPLAELGLGAPLEVEAAPAPTRSPGWRPAAPRAGRVVEGAALEELVAELEARHQIGPAMASTLRSALGRLDGEGRLDLSGERFALLGAGAEIAPTRQLLEAGATVLWCDLAPPPSELSSGPGRLHHARGASDLLRRPDEVAGTVAAFAQAEGPVHLGLFAYGPGQGREWRLAAAMNAVARALPGDALRSVGCLVSPTTPARLDAADAALQERRRAEAPLAPRLARGLRAITPNRSRAGMPAVADVIVPLQGVSYQAAQWLEKTLAMAALAETRPELRVSANTAPITRTRSLAHPVFAMAFRGAPAFGVSTFEPAFTRTLATLAYVEDVIGDGPRYAPKHLHGGLFTLPYSLESAIRLAAARGVLGEARLRT